MSVRDRIDDSQLLFQAGRLEGALISILLAVAATSRKRYPKSTGLKDREAFEQFLIDEREKITAGIQVRIEFNGEYQTLETILYRFVRNTLVHEATLDEHVSFEYGDFLLDKRGTTDFFTFSSELALRLAFAVKTAPENVGCFPEGGFDELPEPIDLKQIAAIKYQWGADTFEVWCSACSVVEETWPATGETIKWLHVKGHQLSNGHVAKAGVKLLIPAIYVLSVEARAQYRRAKKRFSCDVGVFPPEKPRPENTMPIKDIERLVAQLQVPLVKTMVTLTRPHYDL
ncbi:MAG: hypothetical protein DCC68_10840 [Planctomycetota bacterium]|nr:MAG: hypothetical protein DCC68_10840 [Planctomycetota bacterium]